MNKFVIVVGIVGIFIALIIILSILTFIYTRLCHRFWSMQPVMHIHNPFSYFVWTPYILQERLPIQNKYTNDLIITKECSAMSALEWQNVYHLVRHHFLPNTFRPPNLTDISCYFQGHSEKCFISMYEDTELLVGNWKNEVVERSRVKGCITSRPLYLEKNTCTIKVHYIDYLCVAQEYRKCGIAPELIQTHFYNIRHALPEKHVCLFKREGAMTGIIPLCVYATECYPLIASKRIKNAPTLLIQCRKSNFMSLVDFLKTTMHKFSMTLISDYAHLLHLIESGTVSIWMDLPSCHVFFFRKTWFQEDDNSNIKHNNSKNNNQKQSLGCFASICKNKDAHTNSFHEACQLELQMSKCAYDNILIERISDNVHIRLTNMKYTVPTAYFFYNYACTTVNAAKTIVI